jgi:hypothetical protein
MPYYSKVLLSMRTVCSPLFSTSESFINSHPNKSHRMETCGFPPTIVLPSSSRLPAFVHWRGIYSIHSDNIYVYSLSKTGELIISLIYTTYSQSQHNQPGFSCKIKQSPNTSHTTDHCLARYPIISQSINLHSASTCIYIDRIVISHQRE